MSTERGVACTNINPVQGLVLWARHLVSAIDTVDKWVLYMNDLCYSIG